MTFRAALSVAVLAACGGGNDGADKADSPQAAGRAISVLTEAGCTDAKEVTDPASVTSEDCAITVTTSGKLQVHYDTAATHPSARPAMIAIGDKLGCWTADDIDQFSEFRAGGSDDGPQWLPNPPDDMLGTKVIVSCG